MSAPTGAPQRLLAAAAGTLAAHHRLLGPLPAVSAATLLHAATESGLTGRGGAAFSTARKLASVAAAPDPVVVANGAEGEPASSKDRVLLSTAPHLVLDGLQLAVRATGAGSAYLYAPDDLLRSTLRAALRERRDDVPVTAVASPDAFLSGEESAVVQALHGERAVPTSTPPRVFERGVHGRATLVQNVETLAHLALLARFGPAWFREAGTPDEPGTRLLTVSGAVSRPGVVEVEGGVGLAAALRLAGGASAPLSAVLVGGYHGAWVPADDVGAVSLSRAGLASYGAAPGAGVVLALPASVCGLRAGADLVGYLAGQGARQCGPCRNGLPALAGTLRALADGRPTPALVAEVERVSALVEHRGACHHPDGTVRLVRSTLRTFADEVRHHLAGTCTARPTREAVA
jgi:NADH:ubiquinone oxidoreductase subunit F (NADH-binding)